MKLDRFLAKQSHRGRSEAHRLLAARRVQVNGVTVIDGQREIDRFCRITLDGAVVQEAERSLYLMLHKPAGYVCATTDAEHPTVLDLIGDPDKQTLHLVGRLDRNTTGLVLLTNDGRWSKALMHPDQKVSKTYLVETAEPIAAEAVDLFTQGFFFHTENITTLPAELVIIAERRARLTLHEGRYHQVKRMFHRVQNRVVALHRERVGAIELPEDLTAGRWCVVDPDAAGVSWRA